MCKLPELNEYLEQSPEQRDKTTWEFMHDVRTTLGWHTRVAVGFVGILAFASGTGIGVMADVGDGRDDRIEHFTTAMDKRMSVMESAHNAEQRRAAADSVFQQEVLRLLDRIDRRTR